MQKKTQLLVILITLALLFLQACSDSGTDPNHSPSSQWMTDSANVDYKGANQVVFYDLSTGKQTVIDHDTWQIAFDVDRFLVANGGHYGFGVAICSTSVTDFSEDFSSWTDSTDRFTRTDTNYNVLGTSYKSGTGMGSTYTQQVYLAKTDGGDYYKFQVVGGLPMGAGLRMKIGALDDTKADEDSLEFMTGYNYTFVDLKAHKTVLVEPKSDAWDLRFGRTEFLMGSSTSGRSSIAINSMGGAKVYQVSDVSLSDVVKVEKDSLSSDMLLIGNSWYEYDRSTKLYSVMENVYVIQTTEEHYAKVRFLTFLGPNGESFYTKFKYLYQEDGSTTFAQ